LTRATGGAGLPLNRIGTPSMATTPSIWGVRPNSTARLRYVIAEALRTRHSWRSPGFIVIFAGG
jgi:hypothetical protein